MKNEWTKLVSTYVVSILVGGYKAFVLMLMRNWFASPVVRQIVAPASKGFLSVDVSTWVLDGRVIRCPAKDARSKCEQCGFRKESLVFRTIALESTLVLRKNLIVLSFSHALHAAIFSSRYS